jgi:hypothetical protein
MALKVLIILLSLFVSGLLVGNELAVAVFIHPVPYSVSDEAHVRVAKPLSEAAWPLHAVLVRDQSGVRYRSNADHAS